MVCISILFYIFIQLSREGYSLPYNMKNKLIRKNRKHKRKYSYSLLNKKILMKFSLSYKNLNTYYSIL
ncbi:hypothetical protein PFUGPA_05133 [Plasmodium falciparum Palo Alto/Uganda]|uniref:Uncharacterized protein n=4 Tax=Plasmodium falciparum TaxID=5833 RepID=W4IRY4_PLAFP|nr:hypothetical protein PFMALIP_03273 [Plasmodium falciparum MaliPS096_E11]ETW52825.1 hypothetical protein PFUGPA_05133 [Plasmodium falciparum Palo Alto/Uganda]ETW61031.1 hypothetical protein PFMC_03261 [Plasmodium falciparum CAMP/Malaysia]EUR70140.1 hypothetical protein PFBG_03369 [Plasmodium falciparum 7G8]